LPDLIGKSVVPKMEELSLAIIITTVSGGEDNREEFLKVGQRLHLPFRLVLLSAGKERVYLPMRSSIILPGPYCCAPWKRGMPQPAKCARISVPSPAPGWFPMMNAAYFSAAGKDPVSGTFQPALNPAEAIAAATSGVSLYPGDILAVPLRGDLEIPAEWTANNLSIFSPFWGEIFIKLMGDNEPSV
jgi:hypothetical protein